MHVFCGKKNIIAQLHIPYYTATPWYAALSFCVFVVRDFAVNNLDSIEINSMLQLYNTWSALTSSRECHRQLFKYYD